MEISPLGAGHFSGRYGQGCGSGLADEKDYQIPSRRGLAISHVKVLAFYFSLLRPASVWIGE